MQTVNAAVRDTLLRAARYIEARGNMHPAAAIARVQGNPWKRAAAWNRLCDVAGMDFMDHGPDENIDDMIGAAIGFEDKRGG